VADSRVLVGVAAPPPYPGSPASGLGPPGRTIATETVGSSMSPASRTKRPTRHQALSGVLIDDGEQTQLSAVVGRLADEVVGPDVVAMLGPEADARSVVQPEATALGLSGGYFQALSTPDALAICSRPVMHL
jgi:hypothetical protein